MKLLFSFLFLVLFGSSVAQPGYKIDVQVKQFANQYVYLGYYFGKMFPIKDSVKLDKMGKGSFIGKEKLTGGIYLLGYPSKNRFMEIIVDKNQHFSISADTTNTLQSLKYINNPDGAEFQAYQKYMDVQGKKIYELNKKPTTDPIVKADKERIVKEVEQYRINIMKRNPKGLLTTVFNLMQMPIVPEAKLHPGGKYDSVYAWSYFKRNYWNNVNLADPRILRTPESVFESKFDNYFKSIVYPNPDSIRLEVDKILTTTIKNKEVFRYTSNKLIERYINPEYMGLDAVYVHMYEQYVATNLMDWFDEKQKKTLSDRYYFLIGNLIGQEAKPLDLIDTLGKPVSLYKIEAPYTILVFWDATCGHCQEVVPKLDSIYVNKWKAKGVKLMGVMTDGGIEAYKKYIVKHNFNTWIHAYQTDAQRKADSDAGRPNFRQLYDIVSSPKIFLLDEQKRIKAKQITWDQLNDILENLYKNKN